MRRSTLIRFLAIVLVISMLAAPISAAGLGTAANESNEWGGLIGIIIEIIRNIFDSWFRQDEPAEPADPVTSTEPGGTSTSTESGASAPAETVPGESVAENPVYEQTQTGGSQNADVDLSATGNAPVTMGNVNMGLNPMGTVSNVTTTAETTKELVEITSTDSISADKVYIIVNERREEYNAQHGLLTTETYTAQLTWGSRLNISGLNIAAAVSADTTYLWTIEPNADGNAYAIKHNGQYLTMAYANNISSAGLTDTETYMKLEKISGQDYWYIRTNDSTGLYLSNVGRGSGYTGASGFNETGGSRWKIYEVVTTEPEEPDVPEGDSVAHTGLTWQQVKDGTYYADEACTNVVTVTPVTDANADYSEVAIDVADMWADCGGSDQGVWYTTGYVYPYNGVYYPVKIMQPNGTNYFRVVYDINGTIMQLGYLNPGETTNVYQSAITGYNLTDASGNVLASLNGTDLSTTVGVTLYTPKAGDTEEPEQPQANVVYFPVTMYNYHTDALNNATKALDGDTVFRGLYFFNGSPDYTKSTTSDLSNFVAGQYYIQNIRAAENNVKSWISYYVSDENMAMIRAESKDDATLWTLEVEDGNYYLSTTVNGTKLYLTLDGSGADADSFTENKTAITISGYAHNAEGVQLSKGGNYLCQWDGTATVYFGGYGVNNDSGNGMKFYPVGSNTPVAPGASVTKITAGYEEWNRWDKASGDNSKGDLFYTGLVQDEMVDDQIVFNIPQAGIFTDVDDDTKDVYQFVGMPFELRTYTEKDNAGKLGVYYTFDSDRNGVYFEGAPQSGTGAGEDEMHKLHFAPLAPQPMPHDVDVGDHSTNAFLPFNNSWTMLDNGRGQYSRVIDYHFGMRADLPFAMTQNGRIKATDDESEPITFTFSGDDDVWVFIDGHLVIDLGGIHNRLDATINFAENTITYSEENGQDTNNNTGSYNDSTFATTQQLFTADGVEGVIPMSREAFALDADHELQVFYLERGKGTSNGRIEFNLPMNDTVIVSKEANKSWSKQAEEEDLKDPTVDPDVAGIDDLTPSEQAAVDNIDFGFTLYMKTAGAESFAPVANTNFYLIGRGVEGNVIRSTDSNGHFYLKNGQSAKFLTDLPTEGVTYYVVEDMVPKGFIAPDFKFAGTAAYNYTYIDPTNHAEEGETSNRDASEIPEQIIPMPDWDENKEEWINWKTNKSYEVTVKGSVEVQDSIEFKCINFMDAELPNPTAIANEDIIVIDYGLPVQIDPMINDIYRGEVVRIVYWGDENLTLEDYLNPTDGKLAAPKTEFDFGTVQKYDGVAIGDTVTRDTFTYTLNKQLTEVEVISYIIESRSTKIHDITHETIIETKYSLAKIYIVPATVMYYEENFSDMVTLIGSNWKKDTIKTSGESEYQEPGVVGTIGDSIYGSDVAYRNDSEDSNGTSYYGDTTNSAIRFSYTFTGTGTSFFARTSATTGYMQVKIYEGTDIYDENGALSSDYFHISYRDTYWKDENLTELDAGGTLYNIPVFTEEDLPYGTYTLVCTIAKAGTPTEGNAAGAGNEFYLDGIRVMQPLNGVFYTNDDGEQDWVPEKELDELTSKALGAYATDGESNIDTHTLRYKLITDHEGGYDEDAGETEPKWPFAVMTDIDGEIIYASDYVSIGPKEEVYLLPGQSVSFSIRYWHKDGYQIHMGMKAPFGSAEVKVGQTTFALNHAADCYYDITGMQYSVTNEVDEDGNDCYIATYTFTATDSIVSLTNIKVVGDYEFVIVEDTDVDLPGDTGENE